MDCPRLRFTRHAFERMFARAVTPDEVAGIVAQGEVIAEYPDDRPYPSRLMLGFVAAEPVHVVVAADPEAGECHIVTVYRPDPMLWQDDFKSRRQS